MTRLDTHATLIQLAEAFDRLRLRVADHLSTAEEGAFLGLICALEEVIERLPTPGETEDSRP
jgi:hypothetical protein